jgi:hypothetical protein
MYRKWFSISKGITAALKSPKIKVELRVAQTPQ